MSKKRFIIVSTLVLSFPIAYKLLTPSLVASPLIKQINIKVPKKLDEGSKKTVENTTATESSTTPLAEKPAEITPTISTPEVALSPSTTMTETILAAQPKSTEVQVAPNKTDAATTPTTKEAVSPEVTAPKAKKDEATKTTSSIKKAETPKPSSVSLASTDVAKKAEAILAKAPTLNPKVLKLALTAYTNANKKGVTSKDNLLTIIDYSKPSDHKRLWVVDLAQNKVLYNTFAAHGKNTGDRYATSFSNKVNSKASSIGLFVTKQTYQGKHGLSLRIHGLDKGFNDNALKRAVVFHGAPYVNDYIAKANGRIGRSWGCPAIPHALTAPIINKIKNGTLVFAYAPGLMYEVKSKFLQG